MTFQSPKVAIICPSLDADRAKATLLKAASTAGIETELIASHDKDEEGFTKTVNRGLAVALGLNVQYICLLNDDTDPDQIGWLARLVQALNENSKYGIAGPSGPCRSTPQSSGKPGMKKQVKVIPPECLGFFTAVIKREVLDAVGILDERYIHYGSDNDLCLRASQLGWRMIWVPDVYIKHDVGSVKHDWQKLDRVIYRKQWGHR